LVNFSIRTDKETAANDSIEGSAHEFLPAPSAERLYHFVTGIAEQGEIQSLLGPEAL